MLETSARNAGPSVTPLPNPSPSQGRGAFIFAPQTTKPSPAWAGEGWEGVGRPAEPGKGIRAKVSMLRRRVLRQAQDEGAVSKHAVPPLSAGCAALRAIPANIRLGNSGDSIPISARAARSAEKIGILSPELATGTRTS
jgi:hypothetical protein